MTFSLLHIVSCFLSYVEQAGMSPHGWQWYSRGSSSPLSSKMGCCWDMSFHHMRDCLHVPPSQIPLARQCLSTHCSPACSILCRAVVLTIPEMLWGSSFHPCWDKQDGGRGKSLNFPRLSAFPKCHRHFWLDAQHWINWRPFLPHF